MSSKSKYFCIEESQKNCWRVNKNQEKESNVMNYEKLLEYLISYVNFGTFFEL